MKLPAILCDIDGTIALRGDRDPHAHEHAMEDQPNWPVIRTVEAVQRVHGWRIVLVSARSEKFRDITRYWLWTHRIAGDSVPLFMRKDRDERPDQEVKKDIYRAYIEPHYTVQAIFDDRDRVVKMWRELGLPCFQVAEGNY